MARKALLIGAQTGDLAGVVNDVALMAEVLQRRGFTVSRCDEDRATRAGILAAYERLIADAGPGDAVFVYYSGHGGYVRPADGTDSANVMTKLQFIVPVDYRESTADDFRGVTSVELSVLLARLTGKTGNVVVALDCCHAAHLSRDADLTVKAHPRPAFHDLGAHLARQRRLGLRTDLTRPLGNPAAVRVVACAPEQFAYEYTNQSGVRIGRLTEALATALAEAGDAPVTWATLLDRVRRQVVALTPFQRPEAEGPARRLLFDVVEADGVDSLPAVAEANGRVRLDGAALLGVQAGDEFVIMPPGAAGPDPATGIGEVTIDRCGPTAALGPMRLRPPWNAVPLGARGHRVRAVAPAVAVRVPHPDPRTGELVAAIAAGTLVRLAEPGEPYPLAVRVDEAGLTVQDRIGPLHAARPATPAGARQVVGDLQRVARAIALRCLPERPEWALPAPVTVEWGHLVAGEPVRLPGAGAVVPAGELVYLTVRNDGEQTMFVSLIDIGVSARVSVLTAFAPSGVRLDPRQEYVLGWDDVHQQLTGVPVSWPAGLAAGHARPETVLVLVTSQPLDVSILEQDGVRAAAPGPVSPLGQLLAQIATGGTRDVGRATGPAVRYAVRTVDFDLVPAADGPSSGSPA